MTKHPTGKHKNIKLLEETNPPFTIHILCVLFNRKKFESKNENIEKKEHVLIEFEMFILNRYYFTQQNIS